MDEARALAGVETEAEKTTVLVCGPCLTAAGGGPTHLRMLLASPLARRYRLVHVETGSRGAESPATDESLWAKSMRLVTTPALLAWRILRTGAPVVHINSALNRRAFWRDAVYLAVAKLLGCKVLLQLHGGALTRLLTGPIATSLARKVFELADAVVLLANCERNAFEEHAISARLVVVPNAVDIREYQQPGTRSHRGTIRRLLFLGRIMRTKGVFETIEAFRILKAEPGFEDLELDIVGTGPAHDEVARYLQERGVSGSVRLLGAQFGRDKVQSLRAADVLVFPTYHTEGLPYAILESLAAGTPVVTSKVGGIPEAMLHRVHGWLLDDPRNPEEIATALRALARFEPSLREVSAECVEWAQRKLGLERLATQFADLYQSVQAGRES